MKIRHYVMIGLFTLAATAWATDKFTALEQQQISIETPGLFDKSNAFSVDFAILKPSEWSFPLPVGKAEKVDNSRIEITTKSGDNVKAMFEGTVRLSRNNSSYGNVVVLRHDNGLETVYGHNAQNLVQVGQRVKAGQTVAIVGSEGGRTYCIFEIMVDGRRINPETIFDVEAHRLKRQTLICEKKGSRIEVRTERPEPPSAAAKDEAKTAKASGDKASSGADAVDAFARKDIVKLDLTKLSKSEWAYPLPGSHVISPYGGKRGHGGVDIKTKPNDNILAAFDGVVTRSGPYYGYGNCIVIKHPNGLETLYSHQSKNLVKVGQRVKAGQVIGLTGRTGRATTEHLHLEVHCNGRRMNPAVVFDHEKKALQPVVLTLRKNGTVSSQRVK